MYKQLPDIELIELYKKSKDKAFIGELYTRYTGFTFSVCMKYLKNSDDCHDAVMQIFEKLFDSLLVHEVQNFKPWLYSVAKFQCLHILRDKQSKKEFILEPEKFSYLHMENDTEMYLDEKIRLEENIEILEQQISGLSEEQRICVELFYVKDKCYKEIVDETGFTLNQVKSYIQNGKRNLQMRLIKT